MNIFQTRAGFTLVELMLFIGILGLMAGALTGTLISTQEARIRQSTIASVEVRGMQFSELIAKTVRRSEVVLKPAINQTGSILALQMSLNGEQPTIFAQVGSGVVLAQKTATSALIGTGLRITNLVFRNAAGTHVSFSFDITGIIPLLQPLPYQRHFDGAATLFPDDQMQGGGCGSCTLPACVSNRLQWYACETDTCTLSSTTIGC